MSQGCIEVDVKKHLLSTIIALKLILTFIRFEMPNLTLFQQNQDTGNVINVNIVVI